MTAPGTTRLVPLNPGVTTAGATPGASAAALRAPGTPPLPPMPIVPGTAPPREEDGSDRRLHLYGKLFFSHVHKVAGTTLNADCL